MQIEFSDVQMADVFFHSFNVIMTMIAEIGQMNVIALTFQVKTTAVLMVMV